MDDCAHPNVLFYRRRIAGGVVIAGKVCTTCWHWDGNKVKKAYVPNLDELPWYDEAVARRHNDWCHARWDERAAEQKLQRLASKEAWLAEHAEYLRSPEWLERRRRVLQRAGYRCEACLNAPATEVHHVTYDHWGDEPLFDLRAVCHPCHENITKMDRERRGE